MEGLNMTVVEKYEAYSTTLREKVSNKLWLPLQLICLERYDEAWKFLKRFQANENERLNYFALCFFARARDAELLYCFFGEEYDFSGAHLHTFSHARTLFEKEFPFLLAEERDSIFQVIDLYMPAGFQTIKDRTKDRTIDKKGDKELLSTMAFFLKTIKAYDSQVYARQAYTWAELLLENGCYDEAKSLFQEVYPYHTNKFLCSKNILFATMHIRCDAEFAHSTRFSTTMPQYTLLLEHCAESQERILWLSQLVREHEESVDVRKKAKMNDIFQKIKDHDTSKAFVIVAGIMWALAFLYAHIFLCDFLLWNTFKWVYLAAFFVSIVVLAIIVFVFSDKLVDNDFAFAFCESNLIPLVLMIFGLYIGIWRNYSELFSTLDKIILALVVCGSIYVLIREIPLLIEYHYFHSSHWPGAGMAYYAVLGGGLGVIPFLTSLFFPAMKTSYVLPLVLLVCYVAIVLFSLIQRFCDFFVFLCVFPASYQEKVTLKKLCRDDWLPTNEVLVQTMHTVSVRQSQSEGQEESTASAVTTECDIFEAEAVERIGENLELVVGESGKTIRKRSFFNRDGRFGNLRRVAICDNIQTIGEEAFMKCGYLATLEMGQGVKTIRKQAFAYCGDLSEIVFSPKLKEIGEGAFAYCRGLTELKLPTGTKHIGEKAFFYAHNLKKIFIPSTVETIGAGAFEGCKNLTIYAEAESRPDDWHEKFAPESCDIIYSSNMSEIQ